MCSSSGGQNCITQHLVSSHSVGGRPVHGFGEDWSSPNLCISCMFFQHVVLNMHMIAGSNVFLIDLMFINIGNPPTWCIITGLLKCLIKASDV